MYSYNQRTHMGYARYILKSIYYIERHLTDALSISNVASEASYSMYHFHRLFQSVTGETPGSYIRKRRLTEAAGELVSSERAIIDIAMDYQFGSQEAFTRAFQKLFGISPGRFRKSGDLRCARLTPDTVKMRLMHYRGGSSMTPKMVELGKLFMVGMGYYGDNEQGEIPRLWSKFCPKMDTIANRKGCCAYGLCIEPDDYKETGIFEYVAALEVESLKEIPLGMVGKVIPANRYAVFTHKGPITGLRDTYENIYGKWVKDADLQVISGYDFELYDDRFKGTEDADSEIDIYIPMK